MRDTWYTYIYIYTYESIAKYIYIIVVGWKCLYENEPVEQQKGIHGYIETPNECVHEADDICYGRQLFRE